MFIRVNPWLIHQLNINHQSYTNDRMNFEGNSNEQGLLYEIETAMIISCAFEVLNTLGHGLLEKSYENSLRVEFELRNIPWQQQPRYDVIYKSVKVGEYVPNLIAFGFVVVDTKVIERITEHELGQMLNYLKITGHPVGLILNFKRGRLEWKRVLNNMEKQRFQTTDEHR